MKSDLALNTLRQTLFKYTLLPAFKLYWKVCKPKRTGARGLLIHDGNVLLAKNISSRYFSLPGGGVDRGEDPEVAVIREVREELGIIISQMDYKLGEYISKQEGKVDTIHIFVIMLSSPDFQKAWELEDAQWFALDQLPHDVSPATARRIQEYKEGKRDINSSW